MVPVQVQIQLLFQQLTFFSPVADSLHVGFANKPVFTHPVAKASERTTMGKYFFSPSWLPSVPRMKARSSYLSLLHPSGHARKLSLWAMTVAIYWVNLGIRQYRHLLCNCVIILFNCHGSLPYYLQQSRNAVF